MDKEKKVSSGLIEFAGAIVRPGFSKKYSNPMQNTKDAAELYLNEKKRIESDTNELNGILKKIDEKIKDYSPENKYLAWVMIQQVTEEDLINNAKYSNIFGLIYMIAGLILFFYGVGSIRGVFSPMHFLIERIFSLNAPVQIAVSFIFSIILFIRGVKFRHQAWQIENKMMVPFFVWIKKPLRIIPEWAY